MADDAGHAEMVIVEQHAGELLVLREIGAHEARHIIDVAADLPALDDVLDRCQAFFEAATIGLLLQDDLGKDVDRLRQPAKLDDGVIAGDDARGDSPTVCASFWMVERPSRCSAARILTSIRSNADGRLPAMNVLTLS